MERQISEDTPWLSQRVDELAEQVRLLNSRVEELTALVQNLPSRPVMTQAIAQEDDDFPPFISAGLQQFRATTFLSATATVSFLLVIALILRTAADSGVIDQQIGVFVGLAYAFSLFALEHFRYVRARRTVSVYSTCGAILIFAIVLENRVRLEATFSPLAYGILAASLVAMVSLGVRHAVPTFIAVGALGASITGLALGFPEPVFPLLAALLLLANASLYFGARAPRSRWMVWTMFAITVFFWVMWAFKLTAAYRHHVQLADFLAQHWFLPVLSVFVAYYLGLSVRASMRSDAAQCRFELALPVMTIAWSYPIARSVVMARYERDDVIGVVGIAVGLAMTMLALWLGRQEGSGRRAATSFVLAALLASSVALHAALHSLSSALVVWCLIGLLTAVLSWKWKSGLLRIVSYVFLVYACAIAIFGDGVFALQPLSWSHVGVPFAMGALGFFHYRWCLTRPPRGHGIIFDSDNPDDRATIIPLMLAIACVFAALRVPWYAWSTHVATTDTFHCGQSVLLNGIAVALAAIAARHRDSNLLGVACLVAVIGAGKVLGYDFFQIKGLPLVLSVFSFGMTAALGALIWKRWQRPMPT